MIWIVFVWCVVLCGIRLLSFIKWRNGWRRGRALMYVCSVCCGYSIGIAWWNGHTMPTNYAIICNLILGLLLLILYVDKPYTYREYIENKYPMVYYGMRKCMPYCCSSETWASFIKAFLISPPPPPPPPSAAQRVFNCYTYNIQRISMDAETVIDATITGCVHTHTTSIFMPCSSTSYLPPTRSVCVCARYCLGMILKISIPYGIFPDFLYNKWIL